eukprot:9830868-Karenia_brevis.AAC.1
MRKEGGSLTVVNFSAAISTCEKGRQWQFVTLQVSEIRKEGVSINVVSFNAAISACEKGGQLQ